MAEKPAFPPTLIGPRMAVWASFPFDGRTIAPGVSADWAWAMRQWDEVAKAGSVVRLVVADQPYSRLSSSTSEGQNRLGEFRSKIDACHAAGQLVFGRVYAAGGKLPLGGPEESFDDPLNPGHQVPSFVAQVDAWRTRWGDQLDGIFVDSGPTECTDPAVPDSDPTIAGNYMRYVGAIKGRGYRVFVQALQHPDSQPGNPWVRNLGADFLQLWASGVTAYRSGFTAIDPCQAEAPPEVPGWWDPGELFRWTRVHVVNDCRDVDTMTKILDLAIQKRGAGTIWVTVPRRDPSLGPVFDTLPPYWAEQVAYFRPIVAAEEQRAKDAKDQKDGKDEKDGADSKAAKDDKDGKDDKDTKDEKDAKDPKDGKDDKDTKDEKDGKDEKDAAKEDPKEKAEDKEDKENKDGKDFQDDKNEKDTTPDEFLKDSESFKTLEVAFGTPPPEEDGDEYEPEPPPGRTFIRASERPLVGERIVADPD